MTAAYRPAFDAAAVIGVINAVAVAVAGCADVAALDRGLGPHSRFWM